MTQNESYTYTKRGNSTIKIEIERNVIVSVDKIIRVHRAQPVDEPHYYIIEQHTQINADDPRGWAWRPICLVADVASARRFVMAHNIGDAQYQAYAIRTYERFDCPIELRKYTYTATI